MIKNIKDISKNIYTVLKSLFSLFVVPQPNNPNLVIYCTRVKKGGYECMMN